MAQGMLTNYFSGKKRADPFQPSKRRKVLRSSAKEEPKLSVAVLPDLKSFDFAEIAQKQNSEGLTPESSQCKLTSKPAEPVSTTRSRTRAKTSTTSKKSTRTRSSKQKSVTHGPLDKVLARAAKKNDQNTETELEKPNVKDELPTSDNSEDSEVTSVSDDHDATLSRSLPGTPTKRSQQNSEAPIRRKRRKPILSTNETAPGGDTEDAVSASNKVTSTRQKKVLSRSKASVKKSLDKTFEKYDNSNTVQSTEVVKKGVSQDDVTQASASDGIKPVQSQEPKGRRKAKSKSTMERLAEGSPGTAAGAGPEGSKSASNPLGDRIRATLKDQKSPVKQESPAATGNASKGKLTPAMVKERLSKSGKLAELQSRLAKIKECAEQAKKEAKVETKVKSASKEPEKPKSSSSVPAYQKYHSLAQPAPPSLTLPFKYKTLENMFHSVDTVVSLLHNRKETCTFPKLKTAVQDMCRKTFELRNVGQLKSVYPTGYFFSQQKQGTKQERNLGKSDGAYALTVQPNLDSDGVTSTAHDSSEVGNQAMQGATSSLMKKFTPSMLIARRTIFHNSLIDIVKQHHKNFLSTLDRPLSVPDHKLTRWHPKFPLDTIPEVGPSPLPEPPVVKKYSSAKDVLDKARDMMNPNPRVVKALETVAKNSDLLKSAKARTSSSATLTKLAAQSSKDQGSNSKGQSSGLSGINQSLLERIHAKEAQKQVSAMMRDPEDEKRTERLERLPELCTILRVFFVSEKKSALTCDVIIKKLGDSCKSTLSKAEVEKHLDLMIEILPSWLTVHNIRKEKYVKMNKKQDMNDIINKVNKIHKESK